jgi:predicted deacylase
MSDRREGLREGEDLELGGVKIALGETAELELQVSERASGTPVSLAVKVVRASHTGPTVLVTGAVHGDEINGTGVVRALIRETPAGIQSGSLIMVPVVNLLGFERRARYLPDRRDLNRCFPGSATGSLSARYAHEVFDQLIGVSDYCIDVHTGAVQRTNFPNIRADLSDPRVEGIARAFGTELIVDQQGPVGSLRRAATDDGCATVVLEAGEVWKMEPAVVDIGVRGVHNVLIALGMSEGEVVRPSYQAVVEGTKWIRAEHGGLLDFHVAPGEVVSAGQRLATTTDLLGRERGAMMSPGPGVVMGMTTLPVVTPGAPVCNLGLVGTRRKEIEKALANDDGEDNLHDQVREELASNMQVSDPT